MRVLGDGEKERDLCVSFYPYPPLLRGGSEFELLLPFFYQLLGETGRGNERRGV